jgi:hypothetical protein
MRGLEDEHTMNEIYDQLPQSLKSLADITGGTITMKAPHDVDAWYEISPTEGGCLLALMTKDRWLSESIEGDLEHTGDELEELFEEELVELDWDGAVPTFRHFRNDQREYVFSCVWPSTATSEIAVALQAMVVMFTEIGDMGGEDEED